VERKEENIQEEELVYTYKGRTKEELYNIQELQKVREREEFPHIRNKKDTLNIMKIQKRNQNNYNGKAKEREEKQSETKSKQTPEK
jgi:hypothetical protein